MSEGEEQARAFPHMLRRRWVVVVVLTALVASLAGAYALTRSKSYKATTTILLQPTIGNPFSTASAANSQVTTVAMGTEAGLVDSVSVTERVNKMLGTSLQPGSTQVTATVPANTQLIRIVCAASTAAQAQRLAEAYATSFLDYRSDRAVATQQAQLTKLNQEASSAETLLQKESAVAAGHNPPPGTGSKVQLYAGRLDAIQTDIDSLQSANTQPGIVVTTARASAHSTIATTLIILVGGALAGLVLSALVAMLLARRDDRIHSRDTTSVLDLPVLATVPALPTDGSDESAARGRRSPERDEALRNVRLSIVATTTLPAVIAFSPVSQREASAFVVVQLAHVLVQAGYRVVVVDAAVDGTRVAQLMGIDDAPGLSDLLASGNPAAGHLREVDGTLLLPAGTDPSGARERYAGAGISEQVSRLREQADYVLLTTSPLSTSDGASVARAADTVILIATDRVTTHDQISDVKELLGRLRTEVFGVVLLRGRAVQRGRHRWLRLPRRSRSLRPSTARSGADADGGRAFPEFDQGPDAASPPPIETTDEFDLADRSTADGPAGIPQDGDRTVLRARRRGRMTMRRIKFEELAKPGQSGKTNGRNSKAAHADPDGKTPETSGPATDNSKRLTDVAQEPALQRTDGVMRDARPRE